MSALRSFAALAFVLMTACGGASSPSRDLSSSDSAGASSSDAASTGADGGTSDAATAPTCTGSCLTNCCVQGHPGNDKGVGQYCTAAGGCVAPASTCVVNTNGDGECTFPCAMGTDCGANAACLTRTLMTCYDTTTSQGNCFCAQTDCVMSSCS